MARSEQLERHCQNSQRQLLNNSNKFVGEESATRTEFWITLFISACAVLMAEGLTASLIVLGAPIVGTVVFVSISMVSAWLVLAVSASRCRTISISPWWIFLLVLPIGTFVKLILVIVLGITRSKEL